MTAAPDPESPAPAPDAPATEAAPARAGFLETLRRKARRVAHRHVYPDAMLTRRLYRHYNGFEPDLDDPKDLSEKVSWLKLHDLTPLHVLCADKIAVRRYVGARAGADLLVPALLVARDPEALAPERVAAARFAAKTTHDQGGVFLCRDRAAFDWAGARAEIGRRFRLDKSRDFRERQYHGVPPGLLVEALVEGEGGRAPREVKINCFHGAPVFLQVILDRFGDVRQTFLDPDWRLLSMCGRLPPCDEERGPPPACLPRLLEAAAALAAPFLFCRVDFLLGAGDRPWFGEITFHPAAGLRRYRPAETERALGDLLDLSRLGESQATQRRLAAAFGAG